MTPTVNTHIEELISQKKALEEKKSDFEKERQLIKDQEFTLKIRESSNLKKIRLIEKEIEELKGL